MPDTDPDSQIASLLLSQGSVSQEQIDACRAEQDRLRAAGLAVPTLAHLLAQRGFLGAPTAPTLLRASGGATQGSASASGRAADLPPEVAAAATDDNRYGKYIRVSLLGRGGMGEVWRAWDTALRRWVALKLMKGSDPGEIERFRREAQTAAQLNHPNIAAIYEVSDEVSRPFIAMQLVSGSTLAAFSRKSARDIASLLRDVAAAVHYAHTKGVVHRDLKPANVMVEGTRAYVMDFGLAKQVSGGSSLTMSGMLVGTPAYMAPEQARGQIRDIDARSDVYSLGATLYDLLAGRPPFEGKDVYDLLIKVVEEEPLPLRRRNARVDRDLETIVMKCLDKDPARRYATAQELADDLGRWLAGDAILAHPPSILYRARKFAFRRRLLLGAVAAVLITAAVLMTLLRGTRSELLDQMRTTTAASLDAALDARRGGRPDDLKRHGDTVESICRDVMKAMPESPEPHYRLGRLYRALMRDADALREQNEALARDPGYGPALYERILLKSAEHRRLCRKVKRGAKRPDPPKEIARDLELLEKHAGALQAGELDCARGLHAWLEGRVDQAASLLTAAVGKSPQLEACYEALATLALDADRDLESIEWWTKGIERDRGYLPHYEGRAHANASRGAALHGRGQDPTRCYADAIADYTAALAAPRADLWMLRGNMSANLAGWKLDRGRDPTEDFRQAEADLTRSLELEDAPHTRMSRGVVRYQLVQVLLSLGEPAKAMIDAALADLELAAPSPMAEDLKGDLRRDAAAPTVRRMGVGFLETRLRERDRQLDENPGNAGARRDRAETLLRLATLKPAESAALLSKALADATALGDARLRGEVLAAMKKHAEAVAEFDRALERTPDDDDARLGRAASLVEIAKSKTFGGGDGETPFKAAIAELDRLVSAGRLEDSARPARARAWYHFAVYRLSRRLAHEEFFRAAVEDADEVVRRRDSAAARIERGRIWAEMGKILLRAQRNPRTHLERGIDDFTEALKLEKNNRRAALERGAARMNLAMYLHMSDQDPARAYQDALRDFDALLAVEPAYAEGWQMRAQSRLGLALFRKEFDDPTVQAEILGEFDTSIQLNPSDPLTWQQRGAAHYNAAIGLDRAGKDATAAYQKALDDFREAVKLNPGAAREVRSMADRAEQYLKKRE